jgi:dihydrodipicolinate synthase/N-acetylneuraminate lyase
MAMLGHTSDEIRLPLTPLSDRNRQLVQATLKEFGLL